MKLIIAGALILISTAALGGFSMVQTANNNPGPGGYLLDGASAFVTNDAGGKLFAR